MAKPAPEHFDRIGNILAEGDFVAYPSHNSLAIGKITKLNNKMVKVSGKTTKGWSESKNKYPMDCVRLDSPQVTIYLLKQ